MAFSNGSVALRNALATAFINQLDVGTNNAKGALQVRTSGGTTLLVSAPIASTDFSVSSGSAVSDDIAAALIVETGTAAVGRYVDRDGSTIGEITITAAGGGGDLEIASTSLTANGTNTLDLGTITIAFASS